MNYLVKKLLQKGIIREGNVFFLEKTLPVKDGFSFAEIDEMACDVEELLHKGDGRGEKQKIEDSFWAIRKQILEQPDSSRKIALCISMDLAINKEYQKAEYERNLLKLIVTIVIQYL